MQNGWFIVHCTIPMYGARHKLAVSQCEYDPTVRRAIPHGNQTQLEIAMNKLQPMAADEQATLKTEAKSHLVTVTFSVKPNGEKGTARYNLTQVFDFEGVKNEEVLILAVRSLRIDVQSTWRKAKDKMNADVWQDRKWSVRDMLDQTRQKADPVTKAVSNDHKMTAAERKAHLELLTAMVEEDEAE